MWLLSLIYHNKQSGCRLSLLDLYIVQALYVEDFGFVETGFNIYVILCENDHSMYFWCICVFCLFLFFMHLSLVEVVINLNVFMKESKEERKENVLWDEVYRARENKTYHSSV